MNIETYTFKTIDQSEEWQNKERAFLDKISDKEMLSFFKKGKHLYDIMEEIEDAYGESYTEEEYIFNWLDRYDFEEYINKRFSNVKIEHVIPDEELIIG